MSTELEPLFFDSIEIKFLPGFYNGRLIPHGPFLEEWKIIFDFTDYEISNYGRVRSLDKLINWKRKSWLKKGCLLKLQIGRQDYQYVGLFKNNKKRNRPIQRLVGAAFLYNENNLPQVNHIRGFKADNIFTQLEWCTGQENQIHSFKVLKRKGVNLGLSRITKRSRAVIGTDIITGEIKIYETYSRPRFDGFDPKTVLLCCTGKRKTHHKHTWEFLNN